MVSLSLHYANMIYWQHEALKFHQTSSPSIQSVGLCQSKNQTYLGLIALFSVLLFQQQVITTSQGTTSQWLFWELSFPSVSALNLHSVLSLSFLPAASPSLLLHLCSPLKCCMLFVHECVLCFRAAELMFSLFQNHQTEQLNLKFTQLMTQRERKVLNNILTIEKVSNTIIMVGKSH